MEKIESSFSISNDFLRATKSRFTSLTFDKKDNDKKKVIDPMFKKCISNYIKKPCAKKIDRINKRNLLKELRNEVDANLIKITHESEEEKARIERDYGIKYVEIRDYVKRVFRVSFANLSKIEKDFYLKRYSERKRRA